MCFRSPGRAIRKGWSGRSIPPTGRSWAPALTPTTLPTDQSLRSRSNRSVACPPSPSGILRGAFLLTRRGRLGSDFTNLTSGGPSATTTQVSDRVPVVGDPRRSACGVCRRLLGSLGRTRVSAWRMARSRPSRVWPVDWRGFAVRIARGKRRMSPAPAKLRLFFDPPPSAMDSSALTFEEWVRFVFDHPVAEPQWYWDAEWEQDGPAHVVGLPGGRVSPLRQFRCRGG